MIIGIDATNIRAGGGITHIVELLNNIDYNNTNIKKIILWGNLNFLDMIYDKPQINKKIISKNYGFRRQLIWQFYLLKKYATAFNCDIVFVPGGTYLGSFRPFVTMSQNMLPFETKEIVHFGFSITTLRLFTLRFFQSFTFKKASGLIFLSKFAKVKILNILNIKNSLNIIIPHGVIFDKSNVINRQKSINNYSDENPFKIVYVSTIEPYKHQWNVIEAVSNLLDEGFPLSLTLIGSANKKSLRKMIKVKKIYDPKENWCQYTGQLDRSTVMEKIESCNLAVFASSCENLPNIVLEKMAAGLPIASSSYGPMPEILGENCEYFDPRNIEEISNAIRTLILSKDTRSNYVQNNIANLKKYRWENCSHDTFKFIAKTLKKV